MEKKYEDVTREELIRIVNSQQCDFVIHVTFEGEATDERERTV